MNHLIIVQGAVTVTLPKVHSEGLRQDYSTIQPGPILRLSDGTGIKQTRWKKKGTTISGSGALPAGFDALNFGLEMAIWCVKEVEIASSSNVIALPANRRTDITPLGFAVVNNRMVPTPVSVSVGGVATLTAVAGATGYRVYYYPILTVFASLNPETGDINNADHGWELTAEEV